MERRHVLLPKENATQLAYSGRVEVKTLCLVQAQAWKLSYIEGRKLTNLYLRIDPVKSWNLMENIFSVLGE